MKSDAMQPSRSMPRAVYLAGVVALYACGQTEKLSNADSTSVVRGSVVSDSERVGTLTVTFTSDQYKLSGIEIGAIEKRTLSNIVKLNGVIDVEPSSTAMVSAPLGGYVRSAGLPPGQVVRQGQAIATIENAQFTEIQQDFLESKGRMEFLELEFVRQEKLRTEEVNSAKTFQQIASERKIMAARIAGLEQRLALAGIPKSATDSGKIVRTATLYAPIGGFVRISNANIGKYVSPTDVLFEIVDTKELHLALSAYEKDLSKIRIGQHVRFSMANEDTFERTARIFLIGQATGDNRVVPVHCHLTSSGHGTLLPGMYVKAWVETGGERQFAVPSAAIVQLEGKDYVVVQTSRSENEHTFRLQQVRRVIEQEGFIGIVGAEGFDIQAARIVTKNAYTVLSALKNAQEGE